MFHRFVTCAVLLALPSGLMADFSYEQSTKITGGVMAGMMKVAGVFSKSAREPIVSSVAIKGDRMVTFTAKSASVIDLAKETMTEINFDKKQYSVMTFAEFAQMMEELAKDMKKKDGAEMNLKVSVDDTGQTRNVSGLDTRQMIVKMIMEGKDAESGKKGGMTITADMWIASKMPGYDEVTSFQTRMAQKLTFAPGTGLGAFGGPEAAKAFREIYKEGAKLNGMPVVQYIKMGVEGEGIEAAQGGQQQAPPPQQEQQVEKPSAGGAIGSALGGRLGGLGRFGRRKKQEEPPPQQQPAQQQQPAGNQAQAGGPPSFMEVTVESAKFSSAAVDPSKFEVPAGFKQVKPEKRAR